MICVDGPAGAAGPAPEASIADTPQPPNSNVFTAELEEDASPVLYALGADSVQLIFVSIKMTKKYINTTNSNVTSRCNSC